MHNNVFCRVSGTGTPVVRTLEAVWKSGAEQIAGQNNWVQTGLTAVPSQWTGTITGADPQFVGLTGDDFRPASGSPLANAGTADPHSPPGYPFPSPLFPPTYHPTGRSLLPAGTAEGRPSDGFLDVGAYEYRPADDVHGEPALTVSARLEQNFPNPFNPSTVIRYQIPAAGNARLSVHDLLGRQVAVLVEGRIGPGTHEATFHAASLASGIYFYRLQAGEFVQTKCLTLQK
jgi:hypothetical protein